MPASVYIGNGHVEVQQRPIPPIETGQALVEVSHCGICGTDLHMVLEQYARPGSVLGHEWSGTVTAVASDVDAALIGARVVLNPRPGCGQCRACKLGRPAVCRHREPADHLGVSSGSFCQYRAVDAAQLLVLPPSLSTRAAALTEPTAIAIHTVNLSGVQAGDRVLISGGGPVGQLTLAVLIAQGVTDITVTEPSAVRRARSQALGATRCLHPNQLSKARTGKVIDAPFDIAFECSGHADAVAATLEQLDTAGTLVFVGTGSANPIINHNRAIILELTLIGAYNYDVDGFESAVALLASGALPLDLLIEPDDIGLHELGATLTNLANGAIASKVFVQPLKGVAP